MDISKASVHDITYLNDIKYSGLNKCTLIADKGYLSNTSRLDLFSTVKIQLKTPIRNNQNDEQPFEPIFRKCRKRIEPFSLSSVTNSCSKETMLNL